MFKLIVVLAFIAAASAQNAWRDGMVDNRCPPGPYEEHEFPFFITGTGCNDFRICNDGWSYPFTCPSGLNWDHGKLTCNWAEDAPCNGRRWFSADEIPAL